MTTMRRVIMSLTLALAATLISAGADSATLQSWRVLLVAGDDSAAVFDNAPELHEQTAVPAILLCSRKVEVSCFCNVRMSLSPGLDDLGDCGWD